MDKNISKLDACDKSGRSEQDDRTSECKAKPEKTRTKSSRRKGKGLVRKDKKQMQSQTMPEQESSHPNEDRKVSISVVTDENAPSTSYTIVHTLPVVPLKSILSKQIEDSSVRFLTKAQALWACEKLRSHKDSQRHISFNAEAKRESIDDGIDEIGALVRMLAKEGYYFPLDFDWRVPRSSLLRMQISVRLRVDLKYMKFLDKCHRELQKLDAVLALEASGEACNETNGMVLACQKEQDKPECRMSEIDLQQLEARDGECVDSSSFSSYKTCVSAITLTETGSQVSDTDSFQTVGDSVVKEVNSNETWAMTCESFMTAVTTQDTANLSMSEEDVATISYTETTAAEDDDECLYQEKTRKKPWWRRLLSAISCCKGTDIDEPLSAPTRATTRPKKLPHSNNYRNRKYRSKL